MKQNRERYLPGIAIGIYVGIVGGLLLILWLTGWPVHRPYLLRTVKFVAVVGLLVLITILRLRQMKRESRERMQNMYSALETAGKDSGERPRGG